MNFDIVAFRKNYPELWKTILFLGSIQWAGILLSLIAVACAIATFMESSFSAHVAREYIYHAPWFYVWIVCLCVNLLCVTITRLPWKKKHYGFVITHFGIITLLFGAMIGSWFGFEGFAHLKKDEPPTYRLSENQSVMIVQSPQDLQYYSIPLPVEVKKPTEKKPRIFSIPHSELFLKVDQHAEHLERVPYFTISQDPSASWGAKIELASPVMPNPITIPFHQAHEDQNSFDFFGMSKIILVKEIESAMRSQNSWLENQMVFLNSQPIISNTTGTFSGYSFGLVQEKSQALKISYIAPDGKQTVYPLPQKLPASLKIPNASLQVTVDGFWKDFEMKEGVPFSKSEELLNPAVLIRIKGSESIDSKPKLLISPFQEDSVRYTFLRGGKSVASGILKKGVPLSTGWAQWTVELKEVFPKSHLEYRIQPGETAAKEASPGIRLQLLDKNKQPLTPQKWIISGETETVALSSTQVIQVAFGLKTRPIPFGVQLNRFDVPRDEGTDTPAGFISTVWFYDEGRNLVREDHAEMNYPATYPGGLWRSIIGSNYKFSQASWNPDNLEESTLQVLFDPGWLLKWIGSLMISIGILVMYYYREQKHLNS